MNSTLYVYLEIDGKKVKSENSKNNCYKLVLSDIGIRNDKKEINCIIVDKVEFKFLIRNINKYARKKSNTIHKKDSQDLGMRKRLFTQTPSSLQNKQGTGISPSIQDKIRIFSGEFIRKQIYKAKVIPGKLKMPSLFQKENISQSDKKNEKENEIKNKENGVKENDIKENDINDNDNDNKHE